MPNTITTDAITYEQYVELNNQFIAECGFGIQPDLKTFYRLDATAGLTADEIKQYNELDKHSTEAARNYKLAQLDKRYGDDYLNVTADDPAQQPRFDDIALIHKINNQGYLNSLSDSEFQDIANEYVEYMNSHSLAIEQGAIGYDDITWEKMSDSEKEKAIATSQECVNEYVRKCAVSFPEHLEELGIVSSVLPEPPDNVTPNADVQPSTDSAENDQPSAEESESTWSKIAAGIGGAFKSAADWFASTSVGSFIIDKFENVRDYVVENFIDKDSAERETIYIPDDIPEDDSPQMA